MTSDHLPQEHPLKLVLESSILASTLRSGAARNGIFRVTDALAQGLAAQAQVELALWIPDFLDSAMWNGTGALDQYVRSELPGQRVRLAHRTLSSIAGWAIPRLQCDTQPFAQALRGLAGGRMSEIRLRDRLTYRMASLAYRRAVHWEHGRSKQLLAWADIYHATLYTLPEEPPPELTIFINVYDMIPLISPQYFSSDMVQTFRTAVEAFRPDHWFIAISQHTKTDLCQIAGIDPNRVIVALPAADSALFHPIHDPAGQRQVLDRLGLPDEPYFLCLNTIEPRKNMRSVIRAFAELVRQGEIKGCNLVIVGAEGWKREMALDGQETAAELVGRLFFTGPVDDLDLAPLYSGAVGFVYPSHYEGFGLPVLEAMQCGTPVISSATSSLPEVVGDAGLLIDPADLDALAAAMLRLYSEPDLRSDLSARAVARAAGFSWERFMDQVMDGYQLALG